MPFRDSRTDRENDRFRNVNGDTAVAVKVEESVLPNGAATEAKQDVQITQLNDINNELNTITAELQSANASLDAIESDADAIRIATQSIDSDFDVQLSTRASEATQELNRQQLIEANASLNDIEARIETFDTNTGATGTNTLRVEANQGQQTTIANAWPVKITDGTDNTIVKVVKENMQYSTSDHGVSIYGVDPETPRKYRPIRVDSQGDQYCHLVSPSADEIDYNAGPPTASTIRTTTTVSTSDGNLVSQTNRLPVTSVDYLESLMVNGAKTVGTTQVLAAVNADNFASRKSLLIYNNGTVNVYYGGTGVTVANGAPIRPQGTASFNLGPDISVFLISTATVDVRIVEAR